jgi:hypothetical protein
MSEAINLLLEKSQWKPKIQELRMKQEWEQIVGKTISKYTKQINLYQKKLTITTDVPALNQELHLGKAQLIQNINEYFKERVVEDIIIK